MSVRRDKGLFKKDLLDSLSERELAGFVELLSKMKRYESVRSNLAYVIGFDTKTLFGVLHKEVFGCWDSSALAFCKVMENLDKVKEILRKLPTKVACPEDVCPQMPINLQISNKDAGSVFVTNHAWKRFYEHWHERSEKSKPEDIASRLQQSFARSKKVYLEGAYATLRVINNKFAPADYFLDQSANCRFVVIQDGKLSLLTTVERPYSR